MATQLIINTQTNETTSAPVTDQELIDNYPAYLELSFDGTTNTLSAQLKTRFLNNATRNNVSEVSVWRLMIGDTEYDITTNASGAWSDVIQFVDSEPYDVYALSPDNSNRITIQDGV